MVLFTLQTQDRMISKMISRRSIKHKNFKKKKKLVKYQPEPHPRPSLSPVSTLPSTIVPANISEYPVQL